MLDQYPLESAFNICVQILIFKLNKGSSGFPVLNILKGVAYVVTYEH